MKISQALLQWLQSPRRSYAEGVELFKVLAPKEIKDRFLNWFQSAPSGISGTDMHITLLIDKLSRINREMIANPVKYSSISSKEFDFQQKSAPAASASPVTAAPDKSSSGKSSSGKQDLPSSLQPAYDRIREITPLYAKLHSELSAAADDAERKALAQQLCDLDDERRRLWAKIDAWNKDSKVELSEPRPEYSDNSLLRGLQIERSIKRTRDNIGTAKASIARFEKEPASEKRDAKLAAAVARKQMLETTLDELLREKAEIESSQS